MLYDKRWEVKPTVVDEPWRKVIRCAAGLIEQNGHCKNELRDKNGAMCIIAALSLAAHLDRSDLSNSYYIQARAAVSYVVGTEELVDWNNAQERTQEEVVAALREASAQ